MIRYRNRKAALAFIAMLAATAPSSHAQQAAWRPERTVEIVVPAAAGGSIDGTARLIQRVLQNNRIIAVTSEKRGEGAMAAIPTWKEQGVDVVFANVRLLVGPKGMTPAQIAYWDAAMGRVVATEDWKKEVERNEATLDYTGSRDSAQRMAQLYGQLKSALVDAGLAKE